MSNEYDSLSSHIIKLGHWSPCPRKLIPLLGHIGTNLLMHLCTVGRTNSEDGWMLMDEKYLERGLCLNPEAQGKWLAKLQSLGLVEVKMIQGPRIKVNVDSVKELLRSGVVKKREVGFNLERKVA